MQTGCAGGSSQQGRSGSCGWEGDRGAAPVPPWAAAGDDLPPWSNPGRQAEARMVGALPRNERAAGCEPSDGRIHMRPNDEKSGAHRHYEIARAIRLRRSQNEIGVGILLPPAAAAPETGAAADRVALERLPPG